MYVCVSFLLPLPTRGKDKGSLTLFTWFVTGNLAFWEPCCPGVYMLWFLWKTKKLLWCGIDPRLAPVNDLAQGVNRREGRNNG